MAKSTNIGSSTFNLDTPIAGGNKLQLPDGYKGHTRHGAQTSFTSTRKAVHRGREILVRTSYRIDIDGEPLTIHTSVANDGSVRCHGLPNYSFASAVDLARAIIDASLLAFEPQDELSDGAPNDAGGHG
ncbi:hypothetical protein [Breoghania sp. L-A4]|uniref:hypothetical protein n=1 Tax=Breoghania sp. L-A4 TaxID=2304600 RepID=UPI000E35C1F7|nr:hypothetical protein [Breoghania sp. L-A4]AXS39098.1 hypothetical protein D1F64_02270 [Breoghania sp. L-A4]